MVIWRWVGSEREKRSHLTPPVPQCGSRVRVEWTLHMCYIYGNVNMICCCDRFPFIQLWMWLLYSYQEVWQESTRLAIGFTLGVPYYPWEISLPMWDCITHMRPHHSWGTYRPVIILKNLWDLTHSGRPHHPGGPPHPWSTSLPLGSLTIHGDTSSFM